MQDVANHYQEDGLFFVFRDNNLIDVPITKQNHLVDRHFCPLKFFDSHPLDQDMQKYDALFLVFHDFIHAMLQYNDRNDFLLYHNNCEEQNLVEYTTKK